MSQVFETTDVESAADVICRLYTSVRLSSSGDRHLMRIVQEDLGRLRLSRTTLGMHLDMTADPTDVLIIVRMRSGHLSFQQNDDVHLERGDVFVAIQPDLPFGAVVDNAEADHALLDPGLFDEIAETPGAREPVRLVDYHPISAAAAVQWSRTYDMVRALATAPEAISSPLVTAQAGRLLAAASLATFPNNAQFEPSIEDRHDAHPLILRRAIAFIEAHPDLDITVIDIARAANVSPRALDLAFRRHHDTTPMAYLYRVRLDRAHADLQAADPSTDTVADIAVRWGFARPSRFAAFYKTAYGRHPSEVLRGIDHNRPS